MLQEPAKHKFVSSLFFSFDTSANALSRFVALLAIQYPELLGVGGVFLHSIGIIFRVQINAVQYHAKNRRLQILKNFQTGRYGAASCRVASRNQYRCVSDR